MADVNYDFEVSINSSKLADEIRASAIVTALSKIEQFGSLTKVWFRATLSVGDEAVLDDLVDHHDPTPTVDQAVAVVSTVEHPDCLNGVYDLTYKVRPFLFDVPDSAGPHYFDVSIPYDCVILGGTVDVASNMVGDSMQFSALWQKVVGVLTQDVAIGDDHIHVNDTAFANMFKGFSVGIPPSTCLGEIEHKAGDTLYLHDVAAGTHTSGTYVAASFVLVEKYRLMCSPMVLWISRDTERGMKYTADVPMKLVYWNDTGGAKKVQLSMEYYL